MLTAETCFLIGQMPLADAHDVLDDFPRPDDPEMGTHAVVCVGGRRQIEAWLLLELGEAERNPDAYDEAYADQLAEAVAEVAEAREMVAADGRMIVY